MQPSAPRHPRPQLTRERWHDLDGDWAFAFDDGAVGTTDRWQLSAEPFDRVIRVPFPFESEASGIGDPGFHPVVWYRRTFRARRRPGHRVLLHLGAVDHRAHVWLNGHLVATHEGGHTPIVADVTAELAGSDEPDDGRRADDDPDGARTGPEQVLVVRAEDSPGDLGQPRGKQDWQLEPHAIWYARTSGIWQSVWWEEVPEQRIRSVVWRPVLAEQGIDLQVRLRTADRAGLSVRVVLRSGDRLLTDDVYAAEGPVLQRRITLTATDLTMGRSALLWSPEQPTLIDAELTLLDATGTVLDRVGSYTAMRSVGTARDRVLLNGRPYFLRLVLAQNFWPRSHLAAPDPAAFEREVTLVKELGFNGIRLHQKVEDPRFLECCDRQGLLVWAELPAAYEFSARTVGRLTREWLEVLERDRSHPCIVAWVPFNESWGVPSLESSEQQAALVRALYHLTKAVDPDRLVIGNDGWEQPVGDLVTVHDYTSSGRALRERYGDAEAVRNTLENVRPHYRTVLLPTAERRLAPVVVSECGGISFDAEQRAGWRGYGGVPTPERLLAGYRELVGALLAGTGLAGFCWTQLTDTGQERNGLLTAERVPKVPAERVRAVTAGLAAAVPGDAVNEFAYGDYLPEGSP